MNKAGELNECLRLRLALLYIYSVAVGERLYIHHGQVRAHMGGNCGRGENVGQGKISLQFLGLA